MIRFPEVEMRAKGDAVLGIPFDSSTFGRAGLGVEEPELQPAHLEAWSHQHPERRVLQFLAQRLEHFVPRICAVVVMKFLERIGLSGLEESPQVVFGNKMLSVRDLGLFEHTILMLADEVIRYVLLKSQLRSFFLLRHGQS